MPYRFISMKSQDQIDVYGARGLLIESTLAWLWGTAVEHSVLYQYQLSQANNILMGMGEYHFYLCTL